MTSNYDIDLMKNNTYFTSEKSEKYWQEVKFYFYISVAGSQAKNFKKFL